tara:strand:- start:197 stop:709 length:513 start_codon:yes stop_codon:yes gene_type:complete
MADKLPFKGPVEFDGTVAIAGALTTTGTGTHSGENTYTGQTGYMRKHVAHTSAGNTTLTTSKSGILVIVKSNAASGKIVLPEVAGATGMWFDVVVHTAIANDLVVEANASENQILFATSAADNATVVSTGDDITLTASGDVAGDRAHWYCDGTNWHCTAISSAASTWAAA